MYFAKPSGAQRHKPSHAIVLTRPNLLFARADKISKNSGNMPAGSSSAAYKCKASFRCAQKFRIATMLKKKNAPTILFPQNITAFFTLKKDVIFISCPKQKMLLKFICL